MASIRKLWYVGMGELGTSRLSYPLHRAIYRLSGGRLLGRTMGCQVVLLTVRGRKSGESRTVPIFGFVEGRAVVVVASNAGKERHPSWYLNLKASPEAEVQIGRDLRKVRAREATSEERSRFWPRLAAHYGGYEVYRERTAREIPVVVLEPASLGRSS
ncbi:MAG: nitroreductase family deazaflavin-dependent oxidoreductase [Candidatus Rokubacteria bacterium]|nr:nitroreductase family deazaflavin-dependent oxidoreductase [Candidatus Rokubacteria bacterium]